MNKIGALFLLKKDTDPYAQMERLRDAGCECCQVNVWDTSLHTDEVAEKVTAAAKQYDIEISTLWAGWSGPAAWNFIDGPSTLGIVPEAFRMKRMEELLSGGTTLLYVSHNIEEVKRLCDHAIWLDHGVMRMAGDVNEVCDAYMKEMKK